ncbi:putative pentatricopeptide repeat-containing protein [Iris pallida]|uniref:Pentatricopeptide repeat-containing protein n=1 Tax=Iris pallida TaxID=29817 RepID=A0AAX6FG51_IRIPA|nr:putative pentatricopeptide repeat-containing protein [Iris pallida]
MGEKKSTSPTRPPTLPSLIFFRCYFLRLDKCQEDLNMHLLCRDLEVNYSILDRKSNRTELNKRFGSVLKKFDSISVLRILIFLIRFRF